MSDPVPTVEDVARQILTRLGWSNANIIIVVTLLTTAREVWCKEEREACCALFRDLHTYGGEEVHRRIRSRGEKKDDE